MFRNFLPFLPDTAEYYVLALVRMAGLFMVAPVFGRRNIPNYVKIGYSAVLALVALMGFPPTQQVVYSGPVQYGLLVISEALFGAVMGFVVNLFFTIVSSICGHMIDMQMGFGMVSVYDPTTNSQQSISSLIISTLMLLVFYLLDGHSKLAMMMYSTFETVPIGHVVIGNQLVFTAIKLFMQAFLLAINMALPFIAAGLLIEAAMGIIIRSVPQMNMFVIGLPLKVIGGLGIFYFAMAVYTNFCTAVIDQMFAGIETMFRELM